MTERFAPIIAAFAALACGVAWRIPYHRARYGSSAIVVFRSRDSHARSAEIAIGVMAALLAMEITLWTFRLAGIEHMTIVRPQPLAGAFVVALGVVLLAKAQSDLGASWRVGIDEGARPGLIVHGLYRISRNPIYLGLFIILGGMILLMPTVLTPLILVGTVAAIRRQVIDEERYLAATYGDEYRAYARRVGRFMPAIGRIVP